MRLARLKVSNFGPHKELDWYTEGGVIGVTGDNGSGKTHLLLAIELLLTGEIPGNKKSYIREGCKDGYVEGWFEQNGRQGRIKRHLSTGKRELEWDGSPYTKAAEVDEVFSQIIGSAKSSFKNSSFIRQGELKGVLDGTETQRRDILIKLLSLSYVKKRREELDRKIETYVAQNIDDTVYGRKDQQQEVVEEKSNRIEELEARLNDLVLYSNDITLVEGLLAAKSELSTERERLKTLTNKKDTAFNLGNIRAFESAEEEMEILTPKLTKASIDYRKADDLQKKISELSHLKKEEEDLVTDHHKATSQHEMFVKQFKVVTSEEDVSKASQVLRGLEEQTTNEQVFLKAEEDIDWHESQVDPKRGQLTEARKKQRAISATIEGLQKERQSVTLKLEIAKMSFSTLHSALESVKSGKVACTGDKMTCPKCKLDVLPMSLVSEESVQEARKTMDELSSKDDELSQKHKAEEAELRDVDKTADELEVSIRFHEKAIADAENLRAGTGVTNASKESIEVHQKKLESLKMIVGTISEVDGKITILNTMLQRIETKVKACEVPSGTTAEKIEREFEGAKKTLAEIQDKVTSVREELLKHKSEHGEYKSCVERIEYIAETLIPATEERVNSFTPTKNVKDILAEIGTTDFNAVYDVMLERQEKYNECVTELRVANTDKAAAVNQLAEIEKTIKKQEQKKLVLDKLRELRRLLEANTVLKSYLTYRFRKLHNTVSKNLNLLDSNFVIRPSPDLLTYEFLRTDDTSSHWMDIAKLSGGQKVKLSTAFLISVQETICTDINFLVLDEPSTHLDESSVDALSTLFAELATRMSNGNGQFWIVDHHHRLQGAFSKNFQIGRQDRDDTNDT